MHQLRVSKEHIVYIIGKIFLWGSAAIIALIAIAYLALIILSPPPPKPIIYKIFDLKNSNYSDLQNEGCEDILDNLATIIIDISQKSPEFMKNRIGMRKVKEYIRKVLPETIPVECAKNLTKYFVEGIYSPAANGTALYFNINITRFGFVVRNNGKIEDIYAIPGRDSI